jgi:hypothetical protein
LQNIYQHIQENIHLQKVLLNLIHPNNNRLTLWTFYQQQQERYYQQLPRHHQKQQSKDLIIPVWNVICEQVSLNFRYDTMICSLDRKGNNLLYCIH